MQKVQDIAEFGFKIAEKIQNFIFYSGPDAKATWQWISRSF